MIEVGTNEIIPGIIKREQRGERVQSNNRKNVMKNMIPVHSECKSF